MPGLIMDFGCFINARQPALCHVRRIYKKAMELGTVLNVNSKTSPGNSFSGRSRHVARVDVDMCRRAVMDVRNRAEKCIANHGGHFEKKDHKHVFVSIFYIILVIVNHNFHILK